MKAAIFDLDGTLLDTLDDLWEAVNHTMDAHGFPRRTRDEVRAFVGNGVERLIELSLGIPDAQNHPDFAGIVADYRAYYAANSEHKTAPYPGVCDLIRRLLADGIAVSVVSNKPHGATVTLCAKYFPDVTMVCGEREAEGIRRKPWPDTVFKAVDDLGLTPADCVYIGDSEVDILTAKNAGMDCISVLWGFRDEDELREAGGTTFVRTAEELYQELRTKN
ncbi:MAG: HAD-IA family hydrolase [Clostridia bacterium]|nr:HAD-IA family hydrolase [Clostridia bacterium]